MSALELKATILATVYCEGSTAEALHNYNLTGRHNKGKYNSPDEVGGDQTQSSASSRPTPNAEEVELRHRKYSLRYPKRRVKSKNGINPPAGLLFGSSRNVDFRVPGTVSKNTISGWHFGIFVNGHWSWMIVNYSANGTMVNDFPLSKFGQQRALYPDIRNKIRLGQLELYLTVKTVDDDWIENNRFPALREQPKSLPDASLTGLDIQERSQTTDTESSARTTIVVWNGESSSRYGTQLSEKYHVLERKRLPASKASDVRKAIDLETGRHVVRKLFAGSSLETRAKWQKENLTGILAGSPHLVPFLEFAVLPGLAGSLMIIAEYIRGMTLQERLHRVGIYDPSDLILMYGQIAGALSWVHKHGVVHRDLRPEVIITYHETNGGIMSSRLAGFSESCKLSEESFAEGVVTEEAYRAPEMKNGFRYNTQVDVYSLAAIVEGSMLLVIIQDSQSSDDDSVSQAPVRGDTALEGSGIGKLITQCLLDNPIERPSASNIYDRVLDLAGTPQPIWPPFRTFYAEKRFTFSCTEGYIERSEILDALKAFSPTLPISDLEAFTRKPRMKLSNAAKRCHELKLDELTTVLKRALKELEEDESKRQHHTFSCTQDSTISYHAPSMMINISHVRAMVGAAGLEVLDKIGEATRVQVHGYPRWEGVYIDPESFDKCTAQLSDLHFKAPLTAQLSKIANPTLESRFTKFDYSAYAIIVTERLDPNLVLFRRSDRTINIDHLESTGMWTNSDENMVPAPEAAAQCEARGLSDIAAAIRYLHENPEPIEWKLRQLDPQFDNESATSLETTADFRDFDESDDDPMRFRWKRSAKRTSTAKGLSGKRHQPS